MTAPQISVILPTFNRLEFLQAAVESVFAQTCRDWELVIADDGSGEATSAYLCTLAAPQARTIRLPHSGNPSRVRNAAISAARGRYLAFLDSDDLWAPSKLEKQLAALRGSDGARWSYTLENLIDPEGRTVDRAGLPVFPPREGWIFEPLLRLQVGIPMPAIMAERGLVEEIGGFDERLRFGEWHDLCLRLAARSAVVVVREHLCSVRLHNEHYTADKIGEQAGWLQLYAKMAALAPSSALRAHCMQVRAETSLTLARLWGSRGNYLGALSVLREALVFSWRYPFWWWGALKRVLRPAVPDALLSAVRRLYQRT